MNWYSELIEKQAIINLVEKIKSGNNNWNEEDFQLYNNNAEQVEELLKNELKKEECSV